jgi:hypothetical protein
VSGAHYSGVESVNDRRRSSIRRSQSSNCGGADHGATRRQSALPAIPNPHHLAILDDIKDVCTCISSLSEREVMNKPFVSSPCILGIDVRRSGDEGNVTETMAKGCGI